MPTDAPDAPGDDEAAWYRYIIQHFIRHHEGGGWYFNSSYLPGETIEEALKIDKQRRDAHEVR